MLNRILLEKKISKILDNPIFSILFVTLMMLVLLVKIPIEFETNDDVTILMSLAGYMTGEPQPFGFFIGYPLGYIISSLYRINQNLPWYTIFALFSIWLSLIVIVRCFCKIAKKSIGKILMYCLFFMIFLSFILYSVVRLQFTTTGAVCGASVIILLLADNDTMSLLERVINTMLMCILFFICFNFRFPVGYICLAIIIFVCAYRWVNKDISKKKIILNLFFVIAIFTASFISNDIYNNKTDGILDFLEYNKQRTLFFDYPHLSYDQAKDVYESVGWDKNLYDMVEKYFFMDKNYNIEALETINNNSVKHSITTRVVNVFLLFLKNSRIRLVTLCLIIFSILLIILTKKYKFLIFDSFSVIGLFLGCCLALAALAYSERLPWRVINTIVILCIIPAIFILVKIIQKIWNSIYTGTDVLCFNYNKYNGIQLTANNKMFSLFKITLIFSIIMFFFSANGVKSFYKRNDKSESVNISKKIDEFCINNQEDLFIIDNSSVDYMFDPFQVYPDKKPINHFRWGSWFDFSPMYYQKLEINGYEELYSDSFFDKNIYFIGRYKTNEFLINYMNKKFPGCVCKVISDKNDFVVYRFDK